MLNLLASLQEEFALKAVLCVRPPARSFSVVRHIADEVMVIYLGNAVELGERAAIFDRPQHPYTQALLRPLAHRAGRRPDREAASAFWLFHQASRRRHLRRRPDVRSIRAAPSFSIAAALRNRRSR